MSSADATFALFLTHRMNAAQRILLLVLLVSGFGFSASAADDLFLETTAQRVFAPTAKQKNGDVAVPLRKWYDAVAPRIIGAEMAKMAELRSLAEKHLNFIGDGNFEWTPRENPLASTEDRRQLAIHVFCRNFRADRVTMRVSMLALNLKPGDAKPEDFHSMVPVEAIQSAAFKDEMRAIQTIRQVELEYQKLTNVDDPIAGYGFTVQFAGFDERRGERRTGVYTRLTAPAQLKKDVDEAAADRIVLLPAPHGGNGIEKFEYCGFRLSIRGVIFRKFIVGVTNSGKTAARVWKPHNSWGDTQLEFQVKVRGNTKFTKVTRKPMNYTTNVAAHIAISPAATHDFSIDLDDGTWVFEPKIPEDAELEEIRVTLEIERDKTAFESGALPGIWHGRFPADEPPQGAAK